AVFRCLAIAASAQPRVAVLPNPQPGEPVARLPANKAGGRYNCNFRPAVVVLERPLRLAFSGAERAILFSKSPTTTLFQYLTLRAVPSLDWTLIKKMSFLSSTGFSLCPGAIETPKEHRLKPVLRKPMHPVEMTRALIDIESITENEKQVGEYLLRYLSGLAAPTGGTAEAMPVSPERFNVYAEWGRPAVTLSTHMDTVPPFVASRED